MDSFENAKGFPVIQEVIAAVRGASAMLSEIDGAAGDGDHGVNMAKGFGMASDKLTADLRAGAAVGLSEGLSEIGRILLTEIGGAMGPLYGAWFQAMGRECRGVSVIDAGRFESMLRASLEGVTSLGGARVGDKTMVDTLAPAVEQFSRCRADGLGFTECLCVMMKAAEEGKDSTRGLVARVGRSSRLGERSRGVLDAGAVSCWVILTAMAGAIIDLVGGNRACT